MHDMGELVDVFDRENQEAVNKTIQAHQSPIEGWVRVRSDLGGQKRNEGLFP